MGKDRMSKDNRRKNQELLDKTRLLQSTIGLSAHILNQVRRANSCLYSLPLLDGCESNASLAAKVDIAAVSSITAEDSEASHGYPVFL